MAIRIVQLSDLHLMADPEGTWKAVPTADALRDVLRLVEDRCPGADRLILSGDLSHDESVGSYELLRQILGARVPRCRIIPGNHDNRAAIREVFPEIVPAGDGPLIFSEAVDGHRLIGLDSQLSGEVQGGVWGDQLPWLRAELEEHREEPTLLFVHHPPVPVGSRWLDEIGLENGEELADVVSGFAHVHAICVGHIHHEFWGRLAGIPVLSAPSTNVQFRPGAEEFALDALPPGFRVIVLDRVRARLRTRVVRLPELKYPSE